MPLSTTKLGLLALGCLLLGAPAEAARIAVSEEAFLEARLLLQPWVQVTGEGSPGGQAPGFEIFLRRVRVILSGKMSQRISFFFETDSPNFGRNADFGGNLFVQDAFASVAILPSLSVDVGLMLVPFVHNANQGAASLATLDYHAQVIRPPPGSNKVWRDSGLQLRGGLWDNKLQARVGIFNGVRGIPGRVDARGDPLPVLNPLDRPRLAFSARLNLFEPEADFFYKRIYLGKKKVASVGLAGDVQRQAALGAQGAVNATAFGADVFVDLPVGERQEWVFQAAAIRYEQGERGANTGLGLYGELAYRYGPAGPILAFERFISDSREAEVETFHLGGAYYHAQHAANLKLDLAFERVGFAATVQGQLLF